ncbi:MAG: malto-oligosyltrehalose synthase [Acidobacteria bacterium]|nr:malto-oligosyltrehalose synthase [Acidobacteriota bacterium]
MPRTPLATYRMQLHAGFQFSAASQTADYLAALGVSHLYASPYMQAAPGSLHGYDVTAHGTVNKELGGAQAHARMVEKLRSLGLGQVLDIVPNHMAVSAENAQWIDVLENGPSSRYSSFFDIDWNSAEERLRDKVVLPVLGDQYGRVLSRKELRLTRFGSTFRIRYFDNEYPVAPRSLALILARAAEIAHSDELNFLAESFRRLPAPQSTERRIQQQRHRDKAVLQTLLDRLCAEHHEVSNAIDSAIAEWNEDIDKMDDLLNRQSYRLAYWKIGDEELGYRRFFDVNNLIGVRQEREHVFEATHELVLKWLADGTLDGVRVDHPDGLRDPQQYFTRLRERASDAWILGEKILEPGEFLRSDWPIQGTTGYDFLTVCNQLLVEPNGLEALNAIYADYTRQPTDFEEIAYEKKLKIASETLASDVNRLATLFVDICENNRDSRDFTRADIRRAIRTAAACFHIYRTYVVAERDQITDEDRERIGQAIEEAKMRKPDIDPGLLDFLGRVLCLEVRGEKESEFAMRFQQLTGPVMAKGVEDTAFYCYNRLTSLNEVGGDPGTRGLSLKDFHAYMAHMQQTLPETMLTLSTHDTKRADDVRARLHVLTEMPDRFRITIKRWQRMTHPFRTGPYPDPPTEYFFYQTLIGAWPISAERMKAYMLKAMREAKMETSWTQTNTEYEEALENFIDQALADEAFMGDVESFVNRINRAGRINSLAQTLIKCTAPGVPDLYQGGELWDHSLVDPDNRRPVDYDLRRWLLGELKAMSPEQYIAQADQRFEDGTPKLWTIYKALELRRERPNAFGAASTYAPAEVTGPRADNCIAFLRNGEVLTLVPRFSYTVDGAWGGTWIKIPRGNWRNRLTGAAVQGGVKVRVSSLLEVFPVALLAKEKEVI